MGVLCKCMCEVSDCVGVRERCLRVGGLAAGAWGGWGKFGSCATAKVGGARMGQIELVVNGMRCHCCARAAGVTSGGL